MNHTPSTLKASYGNCGRGLYVAVTGRRVVVLHVFEKKTEKTPRRAIETAMDTDERDDVMTSWQI